MSEPESIFSKEYAQGSETKAAPPKLAIGHTPGTLPEFSADDKTPGTGKTSYGTDKPRRIILRAKLTND